MNEQKEEMWSKKLECTAASRHGEHNPNSHLHPVLVYQIKQAYRPGRNGYKRLAKTFLVTPSTVRDIIKHRTWTHT